MYEIRVSGRLSDTLCDSFGELRLRPERTETVLVGALPDEFALRRVLDRIQQFGLELIEVRELPSAPEDYL